MINDVRIAVLAVLNKNNYGYLSPMDFNLYAKQAQLDIFESLFYSYNNQLNLENARRSGTEYANISKGISETIDIFSDYTTLPRITTSNDYILPSDYYYINRVDCAHGSSSVSEAELVSNSKINLLLSSPLTAPTAEYPAYTNGSTTTYGSIISVYPTDTMNSVNAQYIRYPKDPVWTYIVLGDDDTPVYTPNGSTQDFELPKDNFNDLVIKILQYAGVEIREKMVIDFANNEEQKNNIEQQ